MSNNPNRLIAGPSTFNPDDPFDLDDQVDALIAAGPMFAAQPVELPAEVGEALEHLALYHDEGARYEGLAHRCTFDAGNEVF